MTSLPMGQTAPDFTLPDLAGRPHRLRDLRGRIVVLNFWSAECPWSARADADLSARLPAWGERVRLWSLASNANEPPALLRAMAAERGLPLVLVDSGARVADLYAAQTTPHIFVLDAHGALRYRGAYDDVTFQQRTPRRGYLPEAVEALLAGRAPDPAETPAYGCTIVRA